jgi:hypothetical protein
MTPATGFQYTPPSYLVRASDASNRPWNKLEGGEGNDDQYNGDNEYELAQEDRPQTRRESHLNAHFQQRVQTKKGRYRDLLSGDADFQPRNSSASGEDNVDDEDSYLAAAKNADSYADTHLAKQIFQSASNNLQARNSRRQRIAGVREPRGPSTTASDAENARSLRAQRLRNSLIRPTTDEVDLQTKLEMRRLARRDEEAAARKAGREVAAANDSAIDKMLTAEAEREARALAKEEAAVALLRAAEINEERIRQRRNEQLEDQCRRDLLMNMSRRDRVKKNSKKIEDESTAGGTNMTDFDAENDFAFLNDISGIVRDSGILKTCGSCFGANASDDEKGNKKDSSSPYDKAYKAISSVFVPDLAPSSDNSASSGDGAQESESIRRNRVYAQYRE